MKKTLSFLLIIFIFLFSGCVFTGQPRQPMPDKPEEPKADEPDISDPPAIPDDPEVTDIPGKTDGPDEPEPPDTPDEPDEPDTTDIPKDPDPPKEPENKNKVIKIVAAGDNLLHNTISFNAKQPDGSYDFSSVYTRIAPIVSNAQIAFINQEIMLTGEVSGYPKMEAPDEAADALIGAGFNVINLASNHCLDKGEEGLDKCVLNVKQRPFDAILGAFETEEESQKPILVEKDGIVFGFLSYTYDMNGYTLSEGNEWKVALIDEPKMVKDMKAIRPLCDYLIVSMHWGAEYKTEPTNYQRHLAQLLCDYGTDLIIGTHPHVLEPLETITSTNGKRNTLCAWSLGNFISNQHRLETMLGGLLQVEVTFDENKDVISTRSSVIPTVTHYNDNARGYEIYKLSEYTQELAEVHGIRKHAESPLSLAYLQELAKEILKEDIADEVY